MSDPPDIAPERPAHDAEASERAIPFYEKVGRLIAVWNGAERTIKATVGELLFVSLPTCEIIMGSTQIKAKWDIYSSVLRERVTHPTILNIHKEANNS